MSQATRRRYIPEVQEIETTEKPVGLVRVRGRALAVATLVASVLLAGALWAAKVDLDSRFERNAVPLDILSAVYKVLIVVGLLVVARRLGSVSFKLLALLVAALAVGSVVVNADSFGDWLHSLLVPIADVLPVSSGFLGLAIIFVVLAAVAAPLVYLAYSKAAANEKPAVLTVIAVLFVIGIFVGPVNAISSLGINREWLFAEDFGQVVNLAILAGYTTGLLVATSSMVRRVA